MLYNILPPLIFFISLGGIILVVSRVVVRVRGQYATDEIKRSVASASSTPARKPKHFARLVGPSSSRVQFFRNRASILAQSASGTLSNLKEKTRGIGRSSQPTDQAISHTTNVSSPEVVNAGDVYASDVDVIRDDTRPEAATFVDDHKIAPAQTTEEQSSLRSNSVAQPNSPFREGLGKMQDTFKRTVKQTAEVTERLKTQAQAAIPKREKTYGDDSMASGVHDPAPPAELKEQPNLSLRVEENEPTPTADQPPALTSVGTEDEKNPPLIEEPEKTFDATGEEKGKDEPDSDTVEEQPAILERKPVKEPATPGSNITKLFKKSTTSTKSAYRQATEAFNADNLEKAENILVEHLSKKPSDVQAYMLLADIASARQDWDEAIEIYQLVLSIDPGTSNIQAAIGQAMFNAGQFTNAIEALQQAHNDDPKNIQVIESLLVIAKRMDNRPMQASLAQELKHLEAQKIHAQ